MTSQPMGRAGMRVPTSVFTLQYPMSLGVYDTYEQAQKAVDHLSDNQFPVENCLIVGTELKQVERVTGRLTTGRVAFGGLMSGAWLGAFVAMIFALFDSKAGSSVAFVSTILVGAVFGLVWALLTYAATRGRRDFTSVSQVVATKYEVLVEHQFVQQARQILTGGHGGLTDDEKLRAAQEEVRKAQEADRAAYEARQAQGGAHRVDAPQDHDGSVQ